MHDDVINMMMFSMLNMSYDVVCHIASCHRST